MIGPIRRAARDRRAARGALMFVIAALFAAAVLAEEAPPEAVAAPKVGAAPEAAAAPGALLGYSAQSATLEQAREAEFRASISADHIRESMRRLTARPHHVGSAYDKDNAEWILARFKEWGFDAKIETFQVLFPTPKTRLVELLKPTSYRARLEEPPVPGDPTSNQVSEQLPTYNAYSADGDVTAPLVYVNYGNREDYEELDRLGISVKGAIVIARYGGGLARGEAQGRGGTRCRRLHHLLGSEGGWLLRRGSISLPAAGARRRACSGAASWTRSIPETP